MAKYSDGRMIRKSINTSNSFASLSPHSQVLFCLLLPQFNSHGKMNGSPLYIKSVVCPKIDYLNPKEIEKCLKEIDKKTDIKWFKNDGLDYLQAMKWETHQKIDKRNISKDTLPDYSAGNNNNMLITGLKHDLNMKPLQEVEVEAKVEIPAELILNSLEITEWLNYKKEKGQAYKPVGLKAFYRRLLAIPPDRRKEAIEQSMANNYAGVFEKSGGQNNGNNTKRVVAEPNKYDGIGN